MLDEHLLWTKQVNWVNSKLNQTTGILSKLRYNTSLPILKIIYHSLFGSHLQYGTQLWGQENCGNQNIQNLQNRALRKITFKKFHDPINPLYKDLKILKFKDLLTFKTVLEIEKNQALAKSFVTLKHCGDNNNYQVRLLLKEYTILTLLSIRQILMVIIQQNITAFWIGTNLKGFSLTSKKLAIYSKFRSLIKRYFLNKYW